MGKAFGHRSTNIKGDLFQTHYSLTRKLLEVERFPGTILEPCQGYGAIRDVLEDAYGFGMVDGFDLYYGETRRDFLTYEGYTDNIITNPPYGKMTDSIVQHAKAHTGKIAMLLRTNYLSGQERLKDGVFDGLRTVYVFNRMPDLKAPLREDGKFPTGMIVYAWFIWESDYKGDAAIRHLDISDYVLRKGDR